MILEDQGTRILLVTRNGYNSKVESLIMHRMRQISPLLGKAKIEAVEDLVTTRAGKRRWFVDLRKKGEA
jgi:hypothetical protein